MIISVVDMLNEKDATKTKDYMGIFFSSTHSSAVMHMTFRFASFRCLKL